MTALLLLLALIGQPVTMYTQLGLDSTVYWRQRELMTYGCANAPRPRHLDVEPPQIKEEVKP